MAEAEAASILQRLDDLTECIIHRDTYEDPRQLPCMHSFCLECLKNCSKDKPLASNITCPLCRREIPVPADGIEGFPRNFFIDKIIEIKSLKGSLQKDSLCDICQEDEDLSADVVPVASMFCAECRKNLCDRCAKEHRRHNKSHSVLKMGSEEINDQLARKLEVSFCSDHSGKAVEMFCFDCQAVICMVCFAEKHQLHKCSEVNNSAKDFQKDIEREIDKISVCLSGSQKIKEIIDKQKDDFIEQIQCVERKILERSEELRRIIDRDSKLLLDELKIIKSSHLKEMQVKDEEVQRHLTIIASLKAYGKEIVAVGSASDICRSVNQFRTRTKEVQAIVEESPFSEVVCRRVSFQSMEIQANLERNMLGKLQVICEKRLVKDLSDSEKSPNSINANDLESVVHVSAKAEALMVFDQSEKYSLKIVGWPDKVGEVRKHIDEPISEELLTHEQLSKKDMDTSEQPCKQQSGTKLFHHIPIDEHLYMYVSAFCPKDMENVSKHCTSITSSQVGLTYTIEFQLKDESYEKLVISIFKTLMGKFKSEECRVHKGIDFACLVSAVQEMNTLKEVMIFPQVDQQLLKVIGPSTLVSQTKKWVEYMISNTLPLEQLTKQKPHVTNPNIHSSPIADQSQSSRQSKPLVSTSLPKGNPVIPVHRPRKPGDQFNIKSVTSDSLVYESKRMRSRLTVRVHFANIINQNTDVLVSYEDEWLQGMSVLAVCLRDAAGPDIEQELAKISKNHGPLQEGQVVHTSAGKLMPSVKYLVHAVKAKQGQYHPEDPNAFEILYKTFLNCLIYTNDKICKNSISIPPIGLRKVVSWHQTDHPKSSAVRQSQEAHELNAYLYM